MDKIPCINCGTKILPTTVKKFNGLCGSCFTEKLENDAYQKFMNTPGCPRCDGSNYISFPQAENIKNETTKNPNTKYIDYIKEIRKLKHGALNQCLICHAFWYGDDAHILHFIDEQRMPLLIEWSESKNTLSVLLLLKAFQIMPTPPDIYGNRSEYISIPCSITTVDNINYPKALLLITKLPPIRQAIEKVRFSNQIKDVRPSPFALPFKVRQACSMAKEIRMGFSPTIVSSNSGTEFILNGICDFFDHRGITGEGIKLSTKSLSQCKFYEKHSDLDEGIYYFFVDPSRMIKFFSKNETR